MSVYTCVCVCVCVCVLSCFGHVQLCNPTDGNPPGSSVHGILLARYWSGFLCPPSGDLPNSGIEPTSLASTCIGRQALSQQHHLGSPYSHCGVSFRRTAKWISLIYIYMCMFVWYICVCMYVYTYKCIYIYIKVNTYIHTYIYTYQADSLCYTAETNTTV